MPLTPEKLKKIEEEEQYRLELRKGGENDWGGFVGA